MNKPLHKDPSFWIVAITLVGAANVVQFNYGFPWLREKVAASRPAPRMTAAVPVAPFMNTIVQQPDFDFGKKTYSWQKPQPEPRLLQDTPPQVVLVPSEFTSPSGGWGMGGSSSTIGIRLPAASVVRSAYDCRSSRRMILADNLPPGEFDFIANLPTGALEALQAEIKKQWGIVAEREFRQTNAIVLKLDDTNAPGLQIGTLSPTPAQIEAGPQIVHNRSVSAFAMSLENMLQRPVVDQTGLTGMVDIQFPRVRVSLGSNDDSFEQFRTMVLERLGLSLVQTNAPVEMLVVKKVGNP